MKAHSKVVSTYDQPHQFEPLLPQKELGELVERTRDVLAKSYRLQQAVHASTLASLRELVRAMNSYYSNLIEGQGTHPQNIARALKADFSQKPAVAQRQRIALAHIEAEKSLEQKMAKGRLREVDALKSGFLVEAHRGLYSLLSEGDRTTTDGQLIEPGKLRQADVTVGAHKAPAHASVVAFLQRMDEVYPRLLGMDSLLYGIAAAHHRAAWVHPFGDGNGRACRLQTHCALLPMSAGLWSVSRGMARQRDRYYELLANADLARMGDLDGRGNLSEEMLRQWCGYFIGLCDDQASFMAQMLDLGTLRERIAALVSVRGESSRHKFYRKEVVLPLHHIMVAGPITRGDFCRMTGLPERTARRPLSQLLKDGLLVGNGEKGDVSFGFPLDALNILLPNLYPEAAVSQAEDQV